MMINQSTYKHNELSKVIEAHKVRFADRKDKFNKWSEDCKKVIEQINSITKITDSPADFASGYDFLDTARIQLREMHADFQNDAKAFSHLSRPHIAKTHANLSVIQLHLLFTEDFAKRRCEYLALAREAKRYTQKVQTMYYEVYDKMETMLHHCLVEKADANLIFYLLNDTHTVNSTSPEDSDDTSTP